MADYTITEVPNQDVEVESNIKKYDVTTYKQVKDINEVSFTVIDKVERLDIHQLDFDNAQEQKSIEQMTASIAELQERIVERNKMITTIGKVVETEIK